MRRCEVCAGEAQVTVIGLPNRHFCIPHAAVQREWAGDPDPLLLVHGDAPEIIRRPLMTARPVGKPNRQGRPAPACRPKRGHR